MQTQNARQPASIIITIAIINHEGSLGSFCWETEKRERNTKGMQRGERVQTAEGAICGFRSALTNVSIAWQRVSVHSNPRWAVKIVDWGRSSDTAHGVNSYRPRVYAHFARSDEQASPAPRLSHRRVEKWENYASSWRFLDLSLAQRFIRALVITRATKFIIRNHVWVMHAPNSLAKFRQSYFTA